MIAQAFIQEGFRFTRFYPFVKLLEDQPVVGLRGRKPYAVICGADGQPIDEIRVLELIKELFENPFVDYGYLKTYVYLKKKNTVL